MKKVLLLAAFIVLIVLTGFQESVQSGPSYRPLETLLLPRTQAQSEEIAEWYGAYGKSRQTQLYYNMTQSLRLIDQHGRVINTNRQLINMIVSMADPNSLARAVVTNRQILQALVKARERERQQINKLTARVRELEKNVTEKEQEAKMPKEQSYKELQEDAKLLGIPANQTTEELEEAIAAATGAERVVSLLDAATERGEKLESLETQVGELQKSLTEMAEAHDDEVEELQKTIAAGGAPADDSALNKIMELHAAMLEDRKTHTNDELIGRANGLMTAIGIITGRDVKENMLKPSIALTPASARTQICRLLKEASKYITISRTGGIERGVFRSGISKDDEKKAMELCKQLGLTNGSMNIHLIDLDEIAADEPAKNV